MAKLVDMKGMKMFITVALEIMVSAVCSNKCIFKSEAKRS